VVKHFSLLLIFVATGCNAASPTTPVTSYTLTGRVTQAGTSVGVADAIVRILDGPNTDQVATTDPQGNYFFIRLSPSTFTVMAAAVGFYDQTKTVDLTSTRLVVSFELVGGAPTTPSPWDY
jgi:Carboxypeptidase regulatory-like domain